MRPAYQPQGHPPQPATSARAEGGLLTVQITPATRLTALLIVEGPLTFRRIVEAHEARGWPTEPLRPLVTSMLRQRVIAENRDIEYALTEED